jgi:hypothetical protein
MRGLGPDFENAPCSDGQFNRRNVLGRRSDDGGVGTLPMGAGGEVWWMQTMYVIKASDLV